MSLIKDLVQQATHMLENLLKCWFSGLPLLFLFIYKARSLRSLSYRLVAFGQILLDVDTSFHHLLDALDKNVFLHSHLFPSAVLKAPTFKQLYSECGSLMERERDASFYFFKKNYFYTAHGCINVLGLWQCRTHIRQVPAALVSLQMSKVISKMMCMIAGGIYTAAEGKYLLPI